MTNLDELFCGVDDFCRLYLPAWHRQLLSSGERQRRRASRLTLSRHRSIVNAMVNVLAALVAYTHQPCKSSLNIASNGLKMLTCEE